MSDPVTADSERELDRLIAVMANKAADADTTRRTIMAVYQLGVADGLLQAIEIQTRKTEVSDAPRH